MAEASGAATKKCPQCGNAVPELLRIDPGMKLRLQENAPDVVPPEAACPNCYKAISQTVTRGARLRAEQTAREQNKLILWKTRVNLIKQGRALMNKKMLTEAAATFEKYLRVLEIVYDKKPGELTPEIFKDSARTKEITVIASILWDLVRIYDATPRFGDRQKKAAALLILFLQYSPLQPEILRKARMFEAQAKNSGVIKDFIKKADKRGGRCFIATATFQSPQAFEVRALSQFRDEVLLRSAAGRLFVFVYYKVSPPIAECIDKFPVLRIPLQKGLRAIALWLNRSFDLQTPNDF